MIRGALVIIAAIILLMVAASILTGMLETRRGARLTGRGIWGEAMNAIRRMLGLDREPEAPPAAPTRQAVVTDPHQPGLPGDAAPRIERINDLVARTLGRLGTDPLMATMLLEVEQLRDVHLPKLVRSYVEIPEGHKVQIFQETGKSASFHLRGSLDAMEKRLLGIDKALSQENLAAFMDNNRFLASRYGDDDNPF